MRELHGWAPRSVTLDASGAVLSVTVSEPRFTRREVALLLASRRRDNVPRGAHGFPLSVATDPANVDAFKAALPTTDFAEKALVSAKKAYAQRWGEDALTATLWQVEKTG